MDSTSFGYSLAQLLGCSCCCLFAVLVLVGVAVLAFRSSKSKAEGVEGAPAAPDRGSKATASLTKMEANVAPESSDAEGATVVLTRPSQPRPPTVSPAAAPELQIPKPAAPKPLPPPPPSAQPPAPASRPPPPAATRTFDATVVDDGEPKPARPGPAAFVPGRTIVVDDGDDVPMPPPPKK